MAISYELDFTQPPPTVQTLAEANALIAVLWEIAGQAHGIERQVAEMKEQLARNSNNSSQPPSQDGPQVPPKKKTSTGRPRGSQKGHPDRRRELLPPESVDETVPCPVTATHWWLCVAPT
jgi:hypothetical protein